MQTRSRRAWFVPGGDLGDRLSHSHWSSRWQRVGDRFIGGDQTIAVLQADDVSIGYWSGKANHPVACGQDELSGPAGQVDAAMPAVPFLGPDHEAANDDGWFERPVERLDRDGGFGHQLPEGSG